MSDPKSDPKSDPRVLADRLVRLLEARYGTAPPVDADWRNLDRLADMAARASRRSFRAERVDPALLETLAAVALASPTKSDLQQRDIVILRDPEQRARINALLAGQDWAASAPSLLIFCGNNRRQRQLHAMRGRPFVNDHLDAFFNAAVDAAIALAAFVAAAEAVGLGCCPISAIRNEAEAVADLLRLPDHVFPVAGLALGWPADDAAAPSMRLPLSATVHVDRFDETTIHASIDAYDERRRAAQPYARQRMTDRYGVDQERYGWSEDKARQYSAPERAAFGDHVRRRGFKLD